MKWKDDHERSIQIGLKGEGRSLFQDTNLLPVVLWLYHSSGD
jgi:hypothetical protein